MFELADHPLLRAPGARLAARACQLPAWQSNPAAAEAFARAAVTCLDAAWKPTLAQHNLPFSPPQLSFPAGTWYDSPCGAVTVGVETAATYCDGTIYLPFAGLQTSKYGDNPGVYLAVVAHEYGHHVQNVAGILPTWWEQIIAVGEHTDQGQELSRRMELQAQCFSGVFMGAHAGQRAGSITRDMHDAAWLDQETRGDENNPYGHRDHGSKASYAAWWRKGALTNQVTDCNTFAAPSNQVG